MQQQADPWRPFEPSRDEAARIQAELDANTCNLHDDCAAADQDIADRIARSGTHRIGRDGTKYSTAFHCSTEDCEDCFGC